MLLDFNGDGLADYACVTEKTGAIDPLYLNNAKAGTGVTGDGIFLADMGEWMRTIRCSI